MSDKPLKFDINSIVGSMPNFNHEIDRKQAEMRKLGAQIRKEKDEAIAREELTIELLKRILEKDPHVYQQIGQYFKDSNIGQAQNVQDNATATMIVTNTTVDIEEYQRLRNELSDILDLVDEEQKKDVDDVIESLDSEMQSPSPKRGLIKAGVNYISGFLREVAESPTKLLIKAQYTEFLKERTPQLIQGFTDFLKNIDLL